MEENELNLNLVQKLAKVRAFAEYVKKSKSGYNYKYSDITEILAKITVGMKKYHVSLIPKIVPGTTIVESNVITKTKFDKQGKPYEDIKTEMIVHGDMLFVWVNDDNPEETIEVPWFVTGAQEDPSQAFGSGLTYCQRYFMTSYFQIAQSSEDPDSYRSKQKEAEAAEDLAITEEIIKNFDVLVRDYISSNPDDGPKIKTLVSKYVKSGDYTKIKEPKLAAKLMEEFCDTFLKEE